MGNSRSANAGMNQQLIDVVPAVSPEDASSRPPPSSITPTAVVNTDVHVNPDSVKLSAVDGHAYRLSFDYDCQVETWISVYFFATERLDSNGLNTCYEVSPRSPVTQVINKYEPSLNTAFNNPEVVIDVSKYAEVELTKGDNAPYPFIIELKPIYSDLRPTQTQTTFVSLTKDREGYEAKVVKQKFQIGSRVYEIHEMFGIQDRSGSLGEEESSECVVCMSAVRDTAVVPCLHMCLCIECANIVRSQPNSRCPICRTAVDSLLQIQLNLFKT